MRLSEQFLEQPYSIATESAFGKGIPIIPIKRSAHIAYLSQI
jgi:hypothetical protein